MKAKTTDISGAARHILPLAVSLAVLWLLRHKLPSLDVASIVALFQEFALSHWVIAAIFTIVSFAAVGCYDVTVARLLELRVSRARAFSAGWRATAIAQTLGFGLVTGALVRWRLLCLSGKDGLWMSTKMTSLVTASFFYGWLIVAGGAAVVAPGLPDQVWWMGLLALWIGFCIAVLSARKSPQLTKACPPITALFWISALTLLDTAAASAVIYCFLPDGYTPFLTFYVSFLVAYSVGMISGVPAGVGPFEMCLIALLAPADPAPVLAAVLGYRTIYFLVPAVLAGLSLVRPAKGFQPQPHATEKPTSLDWSAEASLVGQGALEKRTIDGSGALLCKTANCEILLRNPVGPGTFNFLGTLKQNARDHHRRLVAYKCSKQVAETARKNGMMAIPVASEATVAVQDFTTDGKGRAQLRRKLRKANTAGVTCVAAPPLLRELQDIDRAWQSRCGRARGFSVGQFCPELVRQQEIFTAYQGEKPVAFITCHKSPKRWVLDLMRSQATCPDGTMQSLVLAAIFAAKAAGVTEFSLCSVPFLVNDAPQHPSGPVVRWLYRSNKSAQGLWRFKSCFAPTLQTEYLCCDGALGLMLGTYELAHLIKFPVPLPHHTKETQIHEDYDNYEFASAFRK